MKLVVAEGETPVFHAWLATTERVPVSSDLARTELLRAVRWAAPYSAMQPRAVPDSITLLQVTTSTFEAADSLDPTALRGLDAIHLAAAVVGDLDLTYEALELP